MTEEKDKLQKKHNVFKALLDKKREEYDGLTDFQREHLESVNKDDLDKGDMMESPTENLMREVRLEGRSLQNLKDEIDFLSDYESFGPSEEVGPASVITTNMGNFVIAVPERIFEVDGMKYTAVSAKSPIYEALKGHKEGDTLKFNGQDIHIRKIL